MGFRGRHNDFLFLVSPLAVIYIPVIIDWEHAGHATLNTLRTRAVNEPSQSLTVPGEGLSWGLFLIGSTCYPNRGFLPEM